MSITMGDILAHRHARMLAKHKSYVVMTTKYTFGDGDYADTDIVLSEDFDDKDTCIARFREVVEGYLEHGVRGTNLYTDESGFFYGNYDVFDEANNCSYSVSMFRRTI